MELIHVLSLLGRLCSSGSLLVLEVSEFQLLVFQLLFDIRKSLIDLKLASLNVIEPIGDLLIDIFKYSFLKTFKLLLK